MFAIVSSCASMRFRNCYFITETSASVDWWIDKQVFETFCSSLTRRSRSESSPRSSSRWWSSWTRTCTDRTTTSSSGGELPRLKRPTGSRSRDPVCFFCHRQTPFKAILKRVNLQLWLIFLLVYVWKKLQTLCWTKLLAAKVAHFNGLDLC